MNAKENSDESIVPATSANNDGAEPSAESIEERDSAKRNYLQADLLRTPGRAKRKSSGLHGVREAARKDSTLKFTALLHHVNVDCLTEAFFNLKKTDEQLGSGLVFGLHSDGGLKNNKQLRSFPSMIEAQ